MHNPENCILSVRIKELRKKHGLTQAQLAEVASVTRSSVAQWESGLRQPDALEVRKICEHFSISSDYLCGRTDNCTTINIPKVYNVDITKLNTLGKQCFFSFYEFLLTDETYTK